MTEEMSTRATRYVDPIVAPGGCHKPQTPALLPHTFECLHYLPETGLHLGIIKSLTGLGFHPCFNERPASPETGDEDDSSDGLLLNSRTLLCRNLRKGLHVSMTTFKYDLVDDQLRNIFAHESARLHRRDETFDS